MPHIIRIFLNFLFLIFYFLIPNVVSASDFSTSTKTTIKPYVSGETSVTQNFTITNLATTKLVDKSTVILPFKDVSAISISDNYGPLKFTREDQDKNIKLLISHPNAPAGVGDSYYWTLFYKTHDIIRKFGSNFEIVVPTTDTLDANSTNSIRVILDKTMGKVVSSWPASKSQLEWTSSETNNKPIRLIISPQTFTTYNAYFEYVLENNKPVPSIMEFPLPSNSQFQSVVIKNITPRPSNVVRTENGGWSARHYVGANKKITVTSEIEITTGDFSKYQEPKMKTYVSKNLLSKLQISFNDFSDIYKFVTKNFTLDNSINSKRESLSLINNLNEKLSCFEVTKLISDIANEKGIQTHHIIGFIYPDSNHLACWMEYFDTKLNSWKSVDPALEMKSGYDYLTQWDPFHIAVERSDSNNIIIPISLATFKATTDTPATISAKLDYAADFPMNGISGIFLNSKIILTNNNPVEYRDVTIDISTQKLITSSPIIRIDSMPPFSRKEIPLSFRSNSWNYWGNDIISLNIDGVSYSYNVKSTPFYLTIQFIIGGLFVATILFAFTKNIRRIPFFRRNK